LWFAVNGPCRDGRPMRKNATAKLFQANKVSKPPGRRELIEGYTHNIQGRAKTQTEGRILKSTYQQIEATKKMAPMMYKSTLVEELLPVSSVNWKYV